MKTKTAFMAGLISIATMIQAQDTATYSPTDAGIRNLVAQVTNPLFLSTNNVSLHPIEEHSFVKVEDSSEHTAVAGTSLFDNISGNEALFRIKARADINDSSRTKNGAQIIVVEPENEMTDYSGIPEHSNFIPPQTAWYEWINPRMFLAKWADFWINETEAQPVVLVLYEF